MAFDEQIAPGVIAVAVAPVLGLVLQNFSRAIRSRILRRGQAVQRIVGESLVAARGVFVIGDAKNISVVTAGRVPFPTWKS